MNILDMENQVINAECSMSVLEGDQSVVIESSGGGNPSKGIPRRNPEYNKLLSVLLARLKQSRVRITKVVLGSTKVADIPVNERIAELSVAYPIDLTYVDIEEFRKEIQRVIAGMHRAPDAKSGGNAQKRIIICIDRNVDPESLVFDSGEKLQNQEFPEINTSLSETEKAYIRTARIGQGQFRKSLIEAYRGRCPITGIENEQLLIASHIKPWKKCTNAERLDPNNGILLSALIDRLFDQGLITFEDDGSVSLSPSLSESDRKKCAVDLWPHLVLNPRSREYLEFHRAVEFKCT
nr:HNH endonuclease [uncultured Desulfuromonas sp.]